MKNIFFYCLVFIITLLSPGEIFAQTENNANLNQYITIVNPIRISMYSSDPKASLIAQYLQVQKRGLAATWLLNYDVISHSGVVNAAENMDKTQELGIFLEVTPTLASESGVNYNKTDSWHRANSVFLSGYTQDDRRKLIDKIFEKFKQVFGFYPSSVGAWWVDSYSLDYMQTKYQVTANLTCADQFATDGYQLWGQFWSTPFYPSRIHAGMPAPDLNSKLNLVTIQWAARDPLNGYGRDRASLFSVQDRYEIEYFKKMADLYVNSHNNRFGQMTIGLEGDFPPQSYDGFFASQLEVVKQGKQNGVLRVLTMKDFSKWYMDNFPDLSPVQVIKSDDILGKKIFSVWYNSPKYRINILYNYDTKETLIRDLRTYYGNFQEPYYISPNRDLDLSINLSSVIDSASNQEEEWKLDMGELESAIQNNEEFVLKYKNSNKILLKKTGIEIFSNIKTVPNLVSESLLIDVENNSKKLNLKMKNGLMYPPEGYIFRDLTQEGTFFLKQKKVVTGLLIGTVVLFIFFRLVNRRFQNRIYKISIIVGCLLLIGALGQKWYYLNSKLYFVNQSEIDALGKLKAMKGKKVVVVDRTCLQCEWHTPVMPAVFANKRNYVKKITGKEVIYNSSIFDAKTRPEAKKELDKINADYIYLIRFEDYRELAPFSPGDLNIEEIYSNANAQIWKVKKS